MRALACAAVLLGGCTVPLTRDTALDLRVEAQSRGRTVSTIPRTYVGLRLSVIHGRRINLKGTRRHHRVDTPAWR